MPATVSCATLADFMARTVDAGTPSGIPVQECLTASEVAQSERFFDMLQELGEDVVLPRPRHYDPGAAAFCEAFAPILKATAPHSWGGANADILHGNPEEAWRAVRDDGVLAGADPDLTIQMANAAYTAALAFASQKAEYDDSPAGD